MKTKDDIFYLNPEHENFVPHESKLTIQDLGYPNLLFGAMFATILYASFLIPTVVTIGYIMFLAPYRSYLAQQFDGKTKATVLACEGDSNATILYVYTANGETYRDKITYKNETCLDYSPEYTFPIRYSTTHPINHLTEYLSTGYLIFNWSVFLFLLFGIFITREFIYLLVLIPLWAIPKQWLFKGLPWLWQILWRRLDFSLADITILDGQLASIEGHLFRNKFDIFDNHLDKFENESIFSYEVVVGYKFISPLGKPCQGIQARERRDLNDNHLPPIGSPLKILYISDRNHIVL